MTSLDRVFQVVFARNRRKLGDEQLDVAWRRACNAVWWILAWPTFALVTVIVVCAYVMTGVGTQSEHTKYVVVTGIIAYFLISWLLARRFRKFLLNPPKLPQSESPADKKYVFWFGAFLNAGAWTVLIGSYILHEAGVRFIQGF